MGGWCSVAARSTSPAYAWADAVAPDLRRRWLDEVEQLAATVLHPAVFRYVQEGSGEEVSVREAVSVWRDLRVAPRVLRDVREVDLGGQLLGRPARAPIGIAPMTLQRAAHAEGEVAMARAAADVGLPMVVSSNAGRTFADIAATGVTWWLQAYLAPDRRESLPLLEAAVAAGAAGVVLTADTPVVAARRRLLEGPAVWEIAPPEWLGANGATTASGPGPEDRAKAMDLGPADLTWLTEVTGLPVVVKGVLRPDDARACVDAGAAAVWVSNHGGRQLDQAVATAHCVQGIRTELGDAAAVLVDGGVRSGLHAMLALALGADGVFVGRPLFHALAAGGEDGVRRALEELVSELVEALRLSGSPNPAATRGLVLDAGS